jgi:hypothetical protein
MLDHICNYVDESSVNLDVQQHCYAWSKIGNRSERIYKKQGGTRFILIPGILLDGVLGIMVQEGTTLQLDF